MDTFGYRFLLPRAYVDGVPCSHPGCLSHRSHPCEGCGRVGGVSALPGMIWVRCVECEIMFMTATEAIWEIDPDTGEKYYLCTTCTIREKSDE